MTTLLPPEVFERLKAMAKPPKKKKKKTAPVQEKLEELITAQKQDEKSRSTWGHRTGGDSIAQILDIPFVHDEIEHRALSKAYGVVLHANKAFSLRAPTIEEPHIYAGAILEREEEKLRWIEYHALGVQEIKKLISGEEPSGGRKHDYGRAILSVGGE